MPFKVSLEGLIGCGKSTFLKSLGDILQERHMNNINIIHEPVEEFQRYKEHDPLKLLYDNPNKNAFFSQQHIISCVKDSFHSQLFTSEKPIFLSERSLDSTALFTNVLYKRNCLQLHEKQKLLDITQNAIEFCRGEPYTIDKIIYIDASPELCLERIKARGRTGEENISLDYLYDLQEEYNEYISNFVQNGETRLLRRIKPYENIIISDSLIEFIQQEQPSS